MGGSAAVDAWGTRAESLEVHQTERFTLAGSVRYSPKSGHARSLVWRLLWAKSGCEQMQQVRRYSITSSVRASSDGGMVRPRAFAVLALMTSSNVLGSATGRSAAFAPRRMRST